MNFESFSKLSLELKTSLGKTLILADPHIAFELSRGIRIRTYFEKKLAEFINSNNPDLVILLGDIKEPIGMSTFTKKLLLEFFSNLRDFRIIITKGNHDGLIEEIVKEFPNVKVVSHFLLDDVLFIHGHQNLPDMEFKKAVLGHIHPAVSVKVGDVVRKAKCFLKISKFLIMPTINPYLEGFEIKEGIKMIPFLKNSKEGEVFLPDGTYLGSIKFDSYSNF